MDPYLYVDIYGPMYINYREYTYTGVQKFHKYKNNFKKTILWNVRLF